MLIYEAALAEVERVESIREGERLIHLASLIGMAYHEPKGLDTERQRLRAARRLAPTMALDAEAVVGHIDALLARVALAERVARRKQRHGDGPDPMHEVWREH